jgi:LuxR family transcriptional regulator, quorum-sensing system regulator SinR
MLDYDRASLAEILNIDKNIDNGTFKDVAALINERLGMTNVVYFSPTLRGHSFVNPHIEMTYSSAWEKRYREANYAFVDPIFSRGLSAALPVDWARVPREDKHVRQFFGEAEEHGCGMQGLTIPVRYPNSPISAIFTITNDMRDAEWLKYKRHIMRDVVLFAHYFHARTYETTVGHNRTVFNLTRREREVILWASEGKTIDDISVIMNLSKDTVKGHLELIRKKTNALNTTHAVSILFRHGEL